MSENGKRNGISNAADSCSGFNALNLWLRTKQLINLFLSGAIIVFKFSRRLFHRSNTDGSASLNPHVPALAVLRGCFFKPVY